MVRLRSAGTARELVDRSSSAGSVALPPARPVDRSLDARPVAAVRRRTACRSAGRAPECPRPVRRPPRPDRCRPAAIRLGHRVELLVDLARPAAVRMASAVSSAEQDRDQRRPAPTTRSTSWRRQGARGRVPGPGRPPATPSRTSVDSGHGHARRAQHVPGAAHGVDHRRPVGVDLLAQVGDVQLDHVGLAAEVVVPDPVQDLGLAQHPARVAHQVAEQLELGRGQLDLDPAAGHLVAVLVQREVADDQRRVAAGRRRAAAPQQGRAAGR